MRLSSQSTCKRSSSPRPSPRQALLGQVVGASASPRHGPRSFSSFSPLCRTLGAKNQITRQFPSALRVKTLETGQIEGEVPPFEAGKGVTSRYHRRVGQ